MKCWAEVLIKVILRFGDFFCLYNFTFNVSSRELVWEDREAIVGIPTLYGERIEWGVGQGGRWVGVFEILPKMGRYLKKKVSLTNPFQVSLRLVGVFCPFNCLAESN